MRRRPRRRQPQPPQKQPVSDVATHGQASAACDSSITFLLRYFFPLFYFLLFVWVAFLTLSPALSHYAGSHPRSVPWLSGVHADVNNDEQSVAQNASTVYAESVVVPRNESDSANTLASSQDSSSVLDSKQEFVCNHLSLEDLLLSMCFPDMCPVYNDGEKKGSGSWDMSRISASNLKVTEQAPALVNQGAEEPLLLRGQKNAVVDDNDKVSESLAPYLADPDKNDADIYGQQQIDQHSQVKSGMIDHSQKNQNHEIIESSNNDTDTASPISMTSGQKPPADLNLSDIVNKTHPSLTNLSRIHLRQEPGDGSYNYASESKGAKVLANNKEAKGASNILNKDKDKYFRTPCNVETKYVDLELSEETLVIEIAIANHEFYSSNVKEFALWGSSTYPSEEWGLLGKFEAENLRGSQSFRLQDPQWVRYLKLQMVSHYGSDFYCTLSVVEVFGVDAIEWFLEDWIAEESGLRGQQSFSKDEKQPSSSKMENSSIPPEKGALPVASEGHAQEEDKNEEDELESTFTKTLEEDTSEKPADVKSSEKSQPVYHQTGRPAIDAVMKLLMQKVRTLEHKHPLISGSLEQMEAKQRELIKSHSSETSAMANKVESLGTELANLNALLHFMEEEWTRERHTLEASILDQFNSWKTNFELLRFELRRVEDKELVAMAVSLSSLIIVIGIEVLMMCLYAIKPAKEKQPLSWSYNRMACTVPIVGLFLVVIVLSV